MNAQTGFFVFVFLCLSAVSAEQCKGTATYMIDFTGTWSNDTHPNFPDMAKFSPLAGCSHNADYMMWDAGMKASPGVQDVAEGGDPTELHAEIDTQINSVGNAYMYTQAKIFDAPGEAKSYIRVSEKFPMVSLISMIIPSPDWFVGVKKIKLCGNDGQWMETAEMDLRPWDAGSKDGETFAFSQNSTMPQGNISIITKDSETPFKGVNAIDPLGKIVFRRVCDGSQTYSLTFQGNWNKQDHPTDFPSGAHFSQLIGASHSALYRFWEAGGMASAGVKQVAETGGITILKNAITAKKNMDSRYVLQIVEAAAIDGTEKITVKVAVDGMHSKVSVISMLGPSPDWFVGIDSLDLCDMWTWRDMHEKTDLQPWDAGTDSGPQFLSTDDATDPPQPIMLISNTEETSFKSSERIKSLGSFLFMRDYEMSTTVKTTSASGVSSVKGNTAGFLLAALLLVSRAVL